MYPLLFFPCFLLRYICCTCFINLANNIRFLGEKEEALELMKGVLKTARKYDDKDLLQKASWLEESLKTGKIPDYVHGERRK